MSILVKESYVNPSTPLWESNGPAPFAQQIIVIDAGGNGLSQPFTQSSVFGVVNKTFIAPSNGKIVAISSVNFGNTAANAVSYTATLIEITTAGATTHRQSLTAGNVTPQYQTVAPVLTLNVVANQAVNFILQLDGDLLGTYKWDWTLTFYPNP